MRRKNGFTLTEVIIASVLLMIVFYFGTVVIKYVSRGSKMALDEYSTQSATRVAAQSISKSVKNTSAMFILPRGTYDTSALSAKWNYFVIETVDVKDNFGNVIGQGSAIVQYNYNSTTSREGHPVHDRVVLVAAKKNIFYSLEVNRDTTSGGAATTDNLDNKLVSYKIVAKDEKGNEIYTENPIESEVQALNTIQVVDLGTETDIGVGFAFSTEEIVHETAPEDIFVGHVEMVLDATGSMTATLDYSTGKTRTVAMREAATQLITGLAKEKNFFVKPVKFDCTAQDIYYQGRWLGFMDMSDSAQVETLLKLYNPKNYTGSYDELISAYATNVGDGIRKAFYDLKDFNATYERNTGSNKYRNYLILLTDGEPNIYSYGYDKNYYTGGGNTPYYSSDEWTYVNGQYVYGKTGEDYAKVMGNYFVNNMDNTKVYFVALSMDLSSQPIRSIIQGLDSKNNYTARNIAELQDVFETIRKSIVEDLWYVNGPQLKQR